MAYSNSPVTLFRRRRFVEPLFRGERTRWVTPFPEGVDAATWAYKVRECFHVALKNPRNFPELSKYAKLYRVEVRNDNAVEAFIEAQKDSTLSTATNGTATKHDEPITLAGTTRFDIVNSFREGVSGVGPWIFPAARLAGADRTKLEAWGKACDPALAVSEDARGTVVSLSKTTQP